MAELVANVAERHVAVRRRRIQFDGPGRVGQGRVQIAGCSMGFGSTAIGIEVLRVELDGPVEIGDGEVTKGHRPRAATSGQCLRVVRVECQSVLIGSERLIDLVCAHQVVGAVDLGLSRIGARHQGKDRDQEDDEFDTAHVNSPFGGRAGSRSETRTDEFPRLP